MAIVGAGFSGTMAAIHLRRLLPRDHLVYLFDRTGRFARGPAFAASGEPYLLNVRSTKMSAFPDQPDHFLEWLERNGDLLPGDIERTEVWPPMRSLVSTQCRADTRLCAQAVAGWRRSVCC